MPQFIKVLCKHNACGAEATDRRLDFHDRGIEVFAHAVELGMAVVNLDGTKTDLLDEARYGCHADGREMWQYAGSLSEHLWTACTHMTKSPMKFHR